MMKIIFILILLSSCSHSPSLGDKKIHPDSAPVFLKEAGKAFERPEYFVKKTEDGKEIFEVKEAEGEKEISASFDSSGNLIEREEDIGPEDLETHLKSVITSYISKEYKDSKIIELEKRTTPTGTFIDVEIRHGSSPSGYWELSFDLKGNFVSREIENYDTPMTHN